MGNSQSAPATGVKKKVVQSGASKYGPYRSNMDPSTGQTTWSSPMANQPDFQAESDLRKWLLNFVSVCDKSDETIVREPGSLAGSQFIINNCTNCNFWLLDYTSTITIDKCEDCRFFVGPCESSLFIRDSKNCSAVIAVGQLRLRDCYNMDFLLYSQTEPVIEKSSKVRFGCFRSSYFNLSKQMECAGLNPWQNRWFNVHDFTPGSGKNWSPMHISVTAKDMLKEMPEQVSAAVSWSSYDSPAGTMKSKDCAIPYTHGENIVTKPFSNKHLFVFVFPSETANDSAHNVMDTLLSSASPIQLVRTKSFLLEPAMAKRFCGAGALAGQMQKILMGNSIGLHFYGDVDPALMPLSSVFTGTDVVVFDNVDEGKQHLDMFFDEFKISEST